MKFHVFYEKLTAYYRVRLNVPTKRYLKPDQSRNHLRISTWNKVLQRPTTFHRVAAACLITFVHVPGFTTLHSGFTYMR